MKYIKDYGRYLLYFVLIFSIVFISAVAYHSVEEIHYLKSFFPREFSVQEAKDASVVELVKVGIIGIPLMLIIFACIAFLKIGRN